MKNKKLPKPKKSFPSKAKDYRFGICGLTSAGKTCLLAALAMARIANEKGYTAKLISPKKGSSEQLMQGWKAIDEARTAIKSGAVPAATEINKNLTLRFEISDGKHAVSYIELTDYSGELLDPSTPQTVLADLLKQDLTKSDGFLIVAEYPKNNEVATDLAEPMHKLGEAFAGIGDLKKKDAIQIPIALLINKWDRSDNKLEGESAYDKALEKIGKFLSGTPHQGLMNQLEAASPAQVKAFPVSAFGPSVYETDSESGIVKERPSVVSPLQSFGLENPFLWLIHERDRIDIEQVTSNFTRFKFRYLLPFAGINKQRKIATSCLGRISSASPSIKKIKTARREACLYLSAQFAVISLLMLVMILVSEAFSDSSDHNNAKIAIKDATNAEGLVNARRWYNNYSYSPGWRHLLYSLKLPKNVAGDQINEIDLKFDRIAWQKIQENDDQKILKELLSRYVGEFPQGEHAADARANIMLIDREIDRQAWAEIEDVKNQNILKDLLDKYIVDFPQGENVANARMKLLEIKNNEVEQELERLIQKKINRVKLELANYKQSIENLNTKFVEESKTASRDFSKINKEIEGFIEDIDALLKTPKGTKEFSSIEWDAFKLSSDEEFSGLKMDALKLRSEIDIFTTKAEKIAEWKGTFKENIEEAGRKLVGFDKDTYSDLYEQYRNNAEKKILEISDKEFANGLGWKSGIDYLEKLLNSPIREIITENTRNNLTKKIDEYKLEGDKRLYNKFLEVAEGRFLPNDADEAERYLNEAPLKAMRKEVQDWIDYYQLSQNENNYRLYLKSIKWSNAAANIQKDEAKVLLVMHGNKGKNGDLKISLNAKNIPGKQDFPEAEKVFMEINKFKSVKSFKFHVKLFNEDYAFLDKNKYRSYGEYDEDRVFLYDLGSKGSKDVVLKNSEDYGGSELAFEIRIEQKNSWVLYSKPSLPAWKLAR